LLSVESARLVERSSDCVQTATSAIFNTPNTTFLHLYVLPEPTNENDKSSPLRLVQNLNSRRDEIEAFVPRLADGDLLQIQELPDAIPTFVGRPDIGDATTDSLTLTFQVSDCGYVHGIAVPIPGSENDTATESALYASEAPPGV